MARAKAAASSSSNSSYSLARHRVSPFDLLFFFLEVATLHSFIHLGQWVLVALLSGSFPPSYHPDPFNLDEIGNKSEQSNIETERKAKRKGKTSITYATKEDDKDLLSVPFITTTERS